ncbi:MAG: DUF1963 domain-containing protein [Clostridia bacterium]|nr:DUF1963 domain-containing protein [Clostridia bacterium]
MDKSDLSAALPKLLKNAVRITAGGETSSPLDSRFGSNPMLPADFVWPYYEGETWDGVKASRPLAFLCQINLADAAPYDTEGLLPDHGMLSVFYELTSLRWGYDPDDLGCVRVYWFEDTDKLTLTAPPAGVTDQNGEEIVIPPYAITFTSEANVPSMTEYEEDWHFWTEERTALYEAESAGLGVPPYEDPSRVHKLLGYANPIQGDLLRECELVSRGYYLGDGAYREAMTEEEYADAMAHRSDWVLLMQIGTIGGYPDFELMWGDMGCVYIMIKKDDLAARRFDAVRLVLQCG